MRLGAYEDLVEIGKGGMGVVFRARGPRGAVAIKVLSRSDPEELALFSRERRLLELLGEREGFVPLLDAGGPPEAPRPYIVMPFLPGGTLRDRLRGGKLEIPETVELARRLARALGAAHGRGIVHRDVKPENVLFTARGKPLLADLGLAKHFDRSVAGGSLSGSVSVVGDVVGTAAYMAPEQLAASKEAGPPADVFSLGAILYECLSGKPVFTGRTVVEVLMNVQSAQIRPLSRKDVPPELAAVVARALDRDPRARFPDGASLARALDAVPLERPRRSPWIAVAAVTAVAATVVLVLVLVLVLGAPTPAPPPPPPPPPRPAPPPPAGPTVPSLVASAEEKLKAKSYDEALALAERAVALDPKSVDAVVTRGKALLATQDAAGALADADRALALDAHSAKAWNLRGNAHMMRQEWDDAIDDNTRALELDPRMVPAWLSRATARKQRGNGKGALEDVTKVTEIDPGNVGAWLARAALHAVAGEIEAAAADSDRAVEVAPGDPDVWKARGLLRVRTDPARAIPDLEKFLELAPDDPRAGEIKSWIEAQRARDQRP